ncbi:MAG: hypothetical protein II451_00315 [Oscillospiraceae bacterium]|nr:hypothetical protein [Oscillospiraceae bacterium]
MIKKLRIVSMRSFFLYCTNDSEGYVSRSGVQCGVFWPPGRVPLSTVERETDATPFFSFLKRKTVLHAKKRNAFAEVLW